MINKTNAIAFSQSLAHPELTEIYVTSWAGYSQAVEGAHKIITATYRPTSLSNACHFENIGFNDG